MNVTEKICIEHSDNMKFMKTLPDNYYSIGITDIQYGLDVGNMAFVKEKKSTVKQKNGTKLNPHKNKKLKPKNWDKEVPSIDYWNEFKRVTREQIFFGVEYVDWDLTAGRIKWNKGVAEGVSFKKYELAYCSFIDYEKEIDYLWSGMMQGKSIKEPMVMQGNKKLNEKRLHITQKPILLWDLIILFCIEKGIDISNILDTNCGLCSLGLSALKFDEVDNITLCDIDKEYVDMSIHRIQNRPHVNQVTIFDCGA